MSPLPSFSWILLQPGRGRHWDVRRFQPLLQLPAEDIPRCWKGTGFLCACPWHWRRAVTSSERVTGTASLAGKVPSVLGPAWSQPRPRGQGCVASISLATGGTSPPLCWPEPNRADRRTSFAGEVLGVSIPVVPGKAFPSWLLRALAGSRSLCSWHNDCRKVTVSVPCPCCHAGCYREQGLC